MKPPSYRDCGEGELFCFPVGLFAAGLWNHVLGKGVGFFHFLCLGIEADVNETDMLEYLADDADNTVIAIYADGIRDGRRFIDAAGELPPGNLF
jgi:acyl-CoA synthetase (NDP forming)